jgi:glycine/sarcosine N-methyltransferase
MLKLRNDTNTFYDAVADVYTLFYRDWDAVMQREGSTLRRLFRDTGSTVKTVLDASCGVGTQSVALATYGFKVTAADPSAAMLAKAKEHAAKYRVGNAISFVNTNFLDLPNAVSGTFDAIVTKGNALPHLITDQEIGAALANFYNLLRPGGMLVIGMRDFDFMLEDRPRFVPRQFHDDDPNSDHILFDVWEWEDGDPITVTLNMFIVSGKGEQYATRKHAVTYRALCRDELETMLQNAGFTAINIETQGWELQITARKP